MGHSKNYKKTKIIPDLERIIPDQLSRHSRRLFMEHIDRYNFALPYVHDKMVADVACGSGYGSHLLANNGAKKVTGIDCDRKTIQYAKKRYPRCNITYKVGEAEDLPLSTISIDVVVSFETIEHIENPKRFLSEAKRVLKKSGLLIISTPNKKYSIGDNPFHFSEHNLEEFNQLLKKYFRDVIIYGQRPVFQPIMIVYRFLIKFLPLALHPLLHMRPWERLDIKKITNIHDDGYVYFVALCKE
ncbi:class I SAM-dependent methyltransferase [Candidatus Roizmanbacteria bacterium]|nr:class I SAM-dependent methyltransferase [Candidatus Roizmanbacteria bacterium]